MVKTNDILMIGVVLIAGFLLLGSGFNFGQVASVGSTGATGAPVTAVVTTSSGDVCPNAGGSTTAIYVNAQNPIPNNNGVKANLQGTYRLYETKDNGATGTFVQSLASTADGAQTFATASGCGKSFFVTFTNASHYSTKSEVFTVSTTDPIITFDSLGANATIQVLADNSTTLGVATSNNITIGSGATNTEVTLKIRANTAQGRLLAGGLVCSAYPATIYSEVKPTVAGATKVAVPSGIIGTDGAGNSYKECWTYNTANIDDYAQVAVPMKFVAISGTDPASGTGNVTLAVLAKGTYTMETGGIVFEGYENQNKGDFMGVEQLYWVGVN